jgi:hypothetical protein
MFTARFDLEKRLPSNRRVADRQSLRGPALKLQKPKVLNQAERILTQD